MTASRNMQEIISSPVHAYQSQNHETYLPEAQDCAQTSHPRHTEHGHECTAICVDGNYQHMMKHCETVIGCIRLCIDTLEDLESVWMH